ncbi:hypothetical protein [Allofustis seminis]|uniref:hypothetical protein n=1 Tax=Allofustis seminis TaxID=166939 RepID=UPI000375175B|nr:hypothetical protein [Allofustis seminis]
MENSGHIVHFPDQPEILRDKIIKAIVADQSEKVCHYVQRLYMIEKNFEVNFIYVTYLMKSHKYVEAYSICQEFEEWYCADVAAVDLYLEVLIANEKYLQAQSIIQSGLKHAQSIEEANKWELYEVSLKEKLNHYTPLEEKSLSIKTIEEFLKEPSQNVAYQIAMVKKWSKECPESLILLADQLFAHNLVNQMTKVQVLDQLIQLKVNQWYHYPWLGQTIEINPVEYKTFNQQKFYEQLMKEAEQLIGSNIRDLEAIQAELSFQCLMLYPLAEQIIDCPTLWIETLVEKIGNIAFENKKHAPILKENYLEYMRKIDQCTIEYH